MKQTMMALSATSFLFMLMTAESFGICFFGSGIISIVSFAIAFLIETKEIKNGTCINPIFHHWEE